jgi:anti-sigma factor RsiW
MKAACRSISPLLGVFSDGELPAERVIDIEQHLFECTDCAERVRFELAVRSSVKRAVNQQAAPSAAFRARLGAALAAERQRSEPVSEAPRHGPMLSWRAIGPLAAAAALSVLWAKSTTSAPTGYEPVTRSNLTLSTAASVDDLIEEFVRHHAMPPAPAFTEPSLVRQLEPEVGVPIRLPSLHQYGARWEGGSVVPVSNQRAASLRYELDGHRVTLYVYDSQRFPLRVTLEPRVVRDQPVYVGTRRGYTVAAVENRGIGYAIATDLSDRESAELAVATVH